MADNQDLDAELAALEERREKLKKLIALRAEVGLLEIEALSSQKDSESFLIILEEVCKGFGVTLERIMSNTRPDIVCQPRHAAFYLAHELRGISYACIARVFAKQHGAIMHGVQAARNRCETDKHFKAILTKVTLSCAERWNNESG